MKPPIEAIKAAKYALMFDFADTIMRLKDMPEGRQKDKLEGVYSVTTKHLADLTAWLEQSGEDHD